MAPETPQEGLDRLRGFLGEGEDTFGPILTQRRLRYDFNRAVRLIEFAVDSGQAESIEGTLQCRLITTGSQA